ncbi:MAG TPA: amidohydrolase family protein [Verrucomicrobiae bacterium]|jgi:cytosine/adenosine deaminase-related metal-dependent hydrolase|nr:amidohydrolase family protein [Verrucomicrobiae bacterium]
MILRARVVLPISRPPIEDGAVHISGNRILQVGAWKDFSKTQLAGETPALPAAVVDLGDSILMPGLINAHCHLDYTDMAGLMPPQKSFTDWIRLMLATKSGWNYSEYAESWVRGAHMLKRTGTTTVADFEAVPELLPEVWSATPLRVVSLLEMTGVKSRRDPRAILQDSIERIRTLPGGRCRPGLAPHAPYSTAPELLRLTAETARRRHWPLSIHLAESVQEFEMFMKGSGVMFDWLRRNDRDMSDCGRGSPVAHLDRCDVLGENCLAVHVNYLADGDARRLAAKKTSVVHCPRSHFYFGHEKFPFPTFARAKVNVCLGTDSLATVYKKHRQTVELNMFTEMQTFASQHPHVSPERILQMATVNGARALGMAGQTGEISEKALADLIAIPFDRKLADVLEAAVHHPGDVTASLIDGEWAIRPPGVS